MRTTIDAAGRMVIPKAIRQRAGILPGMPLEVRFDDGHIEIEPAALLIKLVRKGRFLVAVSEGDGPPLTNDVVEETRAALWRERDILP